MLVYQRVGPSKNPLFVVVFRAVPHPTLRLPPPDRGRERVTCLKFKQRGLIFFGRLSFLKLMVRPCIREWIGKLKETERFRGYGLKK